MPNEIKNPKVLIETIKEVYNFMKAERLMEGFDRKTILRLIMEQITKEELDFLRNAENKEALKDIYKKLIIKFHPDRAPEGKEKEWTASFQSIADVYKNRCNNLEDPEPCVQPEVVVDETEEEMKKEKDQQGQQSSEEQVEDIKKFLEKTKQKYGPLNDQMKQVIERYNKDPRAFFENQEFIDNLIKIAQSLNEQQEQDLGVELKDGDLKGNIERIIAGLEQIIEELLEALTRKAELIKLNPPAEKGEDQKQITEASVRAKAVSWFERVFKKFLEKNPKMKAKEAALSLFTVLDTRDVAKVNEWIKAAGGTEQTEEHIKEIIEYVLDKGRSRFEQIAYDAREKKGVRMFTLPNREEIETTKEERDNVYEITDAADKFVRIYSLLFKLIEKVAQIDTEDPNPNIKPNEPLVALDNIKPVDPEPEKDEAEPEPVAEPDDGDGGMMYATKSLLEIYKSSKLSFNFDEFEKSFLNVSMLSIQSGLYSKLEDSLSNFKTAADEQAGAISDGEDKDEEIKNPSSADNKEPASAKRDDLYEQIIRKVHNLLTERREVQFDDEDMSLFKTEYRELLTLAKFLNQTADKIKDPSHLEKVGGDEILKQVRNIATKLQESIGKVHDVVINELKADIGAGKKLKEQDGDETPTDGEAPTDAAPPKESGVQDPAPYDAHDTEGEGKRVEANKSSWQQKVKDVKNVYQVVVNQLTLLNQLLSSNESRTEARKVNQLIQTSLKSLDSIRTFFPSQSPFGKRMPEGTDPGEYIEEMKRKVKKLVSDIIDIARQLKSTISNKPGLQEETQGVFKDITDPENVAKFAKQLEAASAMIQDYFDAPSKIGKIFANRSPKITNPEEAASMNDAGTKAVEAGQAEEPKAEDADAEAKTQSLTKSSEVNTKLKTFAGKLESLQDTLSKLKTDLRVAEVIQTQDFPRVLAILLNKFPDPKEKVTEERGPKVTSTGTEPSYKLFDLTPQKMKYINSLIKLDNTGSLSMFFNALKKDTQGATALKRYLDKLLPEKKISFNMSYPEAVKLIKLGASKEEPEEQQNEELVRKLEPIIERYINNRKR